MIGQHHLQVLFLYLILLTVTWLKEGLHFGLGLLSPPCNLIWDQQLHMTTTAQQRLERMKKVHGINSRFKPGSFQWKAGALP